MTDDSTPAAPTPGELTAWLEAAAGGDRAAFDRAFSRLYDELSVLARAQRRHWVGNETLGPTALVHDAYLYLLGPDRARDPASMNDASSAADASGTRWSSRRHFFALAAQAMRQLLVNYAERQRAAKRGGDSVAVPLELLGGSAGSARVDDDWMALRESPSDSADEILALHAALQELAARDERQARVVECRFFGGLSIPETADALAISPATVKREWSVARAWLQSELPRVRGEIERTSR
jgi:RNA polymerase sigma factor (TIGR02999 family)